MSRHHRILTLTLIICTFITKSASAGAFQSYELGTPIIGTAAVGQAVAPNDASFAYFNPAGMALLNNSQFMLGTETILTYTNFSPDNATTFRGNNGANAGGLIPGGGTYLAYCYSPRIRFGMSMTSPYGGSLFYNDNWVGRFFVQQIAFYTINVNPSISYKINDCFAVGAGIAFEYINLSESVATPLTDSLDGQATARLDNTSPGFNLGMIWLLTPTTKLGIAYRSQIVHELRGNIGFLNFAITPSVKSKLVTPSNIIASISQRITNRLTLLGEVGWTNWSSLVDTILVIRNVSAVKPEFWKNTWRYGVAGQYQLLPCLLLQSGISYDTSPTIAARRTPDIPLDRQIRIGAGIEYKLLRPVTLGLSYEYENFGEARIHNQLRTDGRILSGKYSRNFGNFVQISLNVEFC